MKSKESPFQTSFKFRSHDWTNIETINVGIYTSRRIYGRDVQE